jgi:hypothetical protein
MNDLKQKIEKGRHEIDHPGHPNYGKTMYGFTKSELRDILKAVAESWEQYLFDKKEIQAHPEGEGRNFEQFVDQLFKD